MQGLDCGADDYITKPFGMMEMVSRVKAVLRRSSPAIDGEVKQLIVGDLIMDIERHHVLVKGEELVLTLKEFEVLHSLMKKPGRVFTREQLLSDIWGYDFTGETRTVDVHIRTLRVKMGASGALIETVRGVGYRMGVSNEK